MILKIWLNSFKIYWRSFSNKLDFMLNIAFIVLLIVILIPNGYTSIFLLKILFLFRLIRILKILYAIDFYQLIAKTFANLIPVILPFIGVGFFIFYFYAMIGIQLFGGLIYAQNPKIYNDASLNILYVNNNFNDVPSAMITLF